MGPPLLDMSSDDCRKILRRMELETYGAVVSTLRAQGELNKDRRKLLQDLSVLLKISPERHKAEVRRAVNDEKLSTIANRMSGGIDTDWAWALEGRRVVPLLPRLLHPTPLTSLATAVTKAVHKNPKIYLNKASDKEETSLRYVHDPDDEDTLSPVMVPIASPDSSCHSNNNLEIEPSEPNEKVVSVTLSSELHKRSEPASKTPTVVATSGPVKRPRSPVTNTTVPLTKIRAVSPSPVVVRPQHKIVTVQHPSPVNPRGPVLAHPRPVLQPLTPSMPGRIRIRAPIVQSAPQRSSPRPIAVQSTAQRPVMAPAVKQVVQIRTAMQQQQPIQPKETNNLPTSTVTSGVASSIAKGLPGKANVIVLHKNSTAARNLTASREVVRPITTKANYPAKSIGTSTGTKVAFPGNVRIITVSGNSNVVNSTSNHSSTPKVASTTTQSSNSSQNVYVLDLSNDELGKSFMLGDIIPASFLSEVNGVVTTQKGVRVQSQPVNIKTPRENSEVIQMQNEVLAFENVPNEVKVSSDDADNFLRGYALNFANTDDSASGNNGNHVIVQTIPHVHEESSENTQVEHGILDPQTGLFYTSSKGGAATCQVLEPSQLDIFSTALASADISLDTSTFNDGNQS